VLDLLLIRHALAEDHLDFSRTGQPDSERPLTDKGERRLRQSLSALQRLLPECEMILTSPLLRARQTADLLKEGWPEAAVVILPALAPNHAPQMVCQELCRYPALTSLALVGHEPDLSHLLGHLIGGEGSQFSFKKGGAAALQLQRQPAAGAARLTAFIPPPLLRRIR
jgi:phosphohistidine phosphatase